MSGGIIDLYGKLAKGPNDPHQLGARGAAFHRLAQAKLDVLDGFVIPTDTVRKWKQLRPGAASVRKEVTTAVKRLRGRVRVRRRRPLAPLLLAVRQSPERARPGLHPTVLCVGTRAGVMPSLIRAFGERAAWTIRCDFLQGFASNVMGMDPELFEQVRVGRGKARTSSAQLAAELEQLIQAESAETIPDELELQLLAAIRHLAVPRFGGTGLGDDSGHAILVQEMMHGIVDTACGIGIFRYRHLDTGKVKVAVQFDRRQRGDDVRAKGEPSTRGVATFARNFPKVFTKLKKNAAAAEAVLPGAVDIGFIVQGGQLGIVDVTPVRLTTRAEAVVALDLEAGGQISKADAVLRVKPVQLEATLHWRVDPTAEVREICRGVAASPGAASGSLVFSAGAAERLAARGGRPVLARTETDPADVGAMHVAAAVITSRGGMTSHAAVVARGLGRPCVTGVTGATIDAEGKHLKLVDGGRLEEGVDVTVDGTSGVVCDGRVELLPPEYGGPVATLLEWADDIRRMHVRANADTVGDVEHAWRFKADGVGLCRTEHMFFAKGRINAMREVILAESEAERRPALERLRSIQHNDFLELFLAMRGQPVVIRLLDPPLHEFLPHGGREMLELAEDMHVPVDQVMARAAALQEFNPMLGHRGCRVGIVHPEIYEMQTRAILEAALAAWRKTDAPPAPEIMVPLVSTRREMELLRGRIDAVAAEVAQETGQTVQYRVGAMIETPRAALRAEEITDFAHFLSFGTNDLTQMTYGLSRDDAGRFMPSYLRQNVFDADPFATIDGEGVGELVTMAVARARASDRGIELGLCGEHGADPATLDLCEHLGFDYVSCSPYRVPVARLAAAQATVRATRRS